MNRILSVLICGLLYSCSALGAQCSRAGVLPITTIIEHGKSVQYLLLGREGYGRDKGSWDAFAGRMESTDKEPIDAASREFYEEAILSKTLGWSLAYTKKYISDRTNTRGIQITPVKDRATHLYITSFPETLIQLICRKFYRALRVVPRGAFSEKDRIGLVKIADIKKSIALGGKAIRTIAFPIDPHMRNKRLETIAIRPILVNELQRAISSGLI